MCEKNILSREVYHIYVVHTRGWKVLLSLRGRPTYEEELGVYKSPYFGSAMAESKVRG